MRLFEIAGLSLAAAAGGLYATDALTAGEVYDLPFQSAYAELAVMSLPSEVTQLSLGAGKNIEVRKTASEISWLFLTDGEEAGRFVAKLSPEGAGKTRVVVDYVPGAAVPEEMLRLSDTQLMRKLAAAAMAEQVDSRLEGRPFQLSGSMQRTAEYLQNNPDALREYGEAIGHTMRGMHEIARRNAEDAVVLSEEQRVGKPSPDATRPSMDLSSY